MLVPLPSGKVDRRAFLAFWSLPWWLVPATAHDEAVACLEPSLKLLRNGGRNRSGSA